MHVRMLRRVKRANSSVGRASALQAGGHRFESCFAHHYFTMMVGFSLCIVFFNPQGYSSVAQSVEQTTVNRWVTGSSPVRGAKGL